MTRHRQATRAEQRPARVLCGEEFIIPAFVESSSSEVMTGWRCQPQAVARFRVCWLGRFANRVWRSPPIVCGVDVDAEEIGEYCGGQLGREHDQGCVAACARADPTLFESPREDSRVDRSVGGAGRCNGTRPS
jgi:hypothetical protein